MGRRSTYPPGVFCWVELATTAPTAAAAFYEEVLGWAVAPPEPDGEDAEADARLGGDLVAAVRPLDPAAGDRTVPHWVSYVAVADLPATAARAQELGGEVSVPVAAPAGTGHRAMLRDPEGGVLGLWQAQDRPGAARVDDPGCLCWNELGAAEPEHASAFYTALFGWGVDRDDSEGQPYWTIRHDDAARGLNGGLRGLTPPERQAQLPPHWLPYFTVTDIDDVFTRIASAGGERLAGPVTQPFGRFGVLADPQQAAFAVFEGEVDD